VVADTRGFYASALMNAAIVVGVQIGHSGVFS
jgi:hypothetical protein